MKLRVGQTLASTVDVTTVVVVRAPDDDVALTCGGAEMVDAKEAPATKGAADPDASAGTQLGKRYVDGGDTVELLCTKAGEGTLAIDGEPLVIKQAKALPASD
ncbi:MAG: hypothetical protein ACJ735_12085 [Actinomycetes bacterium]